LVTAQVSHQLEALRDGLDSKAAISQVITNMPDIGRPWATSACTSTHSPAVWLDPKRNVSRVPEIGKLRSVAARSMLASWDAAA
jgi:hypothetical protein